jgi:hypothetical protein
VGGVLAPPQEEEFRVMQAENIQRITNFLSEFYTSRDEAEVFVAKCEQHADPTYKRILHQIERMIKFSDEVDKFETGSVKDGIKVFFWMACIEAINKASEKESKGTKKGIVEDFFKSYVSQEDQLKLLQSFKQMDPDGITHKVESIEEVANIFNANRNVFAHEGIYLDVCLPFSA